MSGVAFCVLVKIRKDLCAVNEVDSLTEDQHISSSLALKASLKQPCLQNCRGITLNYSLLSVKK